MDYNAIAVDDIKDVHRYLMKKKIWYDKYVRIPKKVIYKNVCIFIKKIFYIGYLFLSSLVSTSPLSCISTKNQECKVRPEIINVSSNNPIFYPFSIRINVVVIVIILITHMQTFVFLMKLMKLDL